MPTGFESRAATLSAVAVDSVAPIEVGPGCWRRDLPSREGLRLWIVDMAPGAQWPHVDQHDGGGEDVLVVNGELIEGDARHGPGTYLNFAPDSAHQPRTETGVRLFGINLAVPVPSPATGMSAIADGRGGA